MPFARVAAVTFAAELVQLRPSGTVASSLTTIAVGTAGVSVLLIRSFFAEREISPFGVTGHEQQEMSCSSGENAYTLTHSAPVMLAVVPDSSAAPRVPALVMLMTESPNPRLGK